MVCGRLVTSWQGATPAAPAWSQSNSCSARGRVARAHGQLASRQPAHCQVENLADRQLTPWACKASCRSLACVLCPTLSPPSSTMNGARRDWEGEAAATATRRACVVAPGGRCMAVGTRARFNEAVSCILAALWRRGDLWRGWDVGMVDGLLLSCAAGACLVAWLRASVEKENVSVGACS